MQGLQCVWWETELRVEVREDECDEGVRVMDVGFYQFCVLVEEIRVCKWGFGDSEEIIFWNLKVSY